MKSVLTITACIVLPLAIPLSLAALTYHLGTGPTVDRVIRDFQEGDEELKKDALGWFTKLRRTTLWETVTPLLQHEEGRVRRYAIRALEKMKNPESLPALDAAMEAAAARGDSDQGADIIAAMANIGYPQVFPYLEKWMQHPDQKIKFEAGEKFIGLRKALNQEVCFHSLGDPKYNYLGYLLESQAELFPEGRALIEAGPNKLARDRSGDGAPTP